MFVVCVTIWVEPGLEEQFLHATEANHRGTRAEPGNLRFDVLRRVDEPAQFFFYEVYRTEADFQAHQQTDHYRKWKETVSGWMARPRQGVKYTSSFPADEEF
ncbi:MAG: antibiotic biosynthesis monooxygenase [Planctomycetota bacterium]